MSHIEKCKVFSIDMKFGLSPKFYKVFENLIELITKTLSPIFDKFIKIINAKTYDMP